jgi:hypothetical protein
MFLSNTHIVNLMLAQRIFQAKFKVCGTLLNQEIALCFANYQLFR